MNGISEAPPEGSAGVASRRWSFGQVVLDERTLELRVADRLARLERKPLEVLMYLLRHANEVVTKDELAENLWPGRILSENVVARCVSMLREALGDERDAIRTIHGYGYRLAADVKVERSLGPALPSFDFKVGGTPPLRPQWKLAERLGRGGYGEAWLARHDKTGEARVFKFALDEQALASLKREITLYRLLHDALGDRAPVVRLLEWNLEEPPYFIETEYVEGRDLCSWADRQGGLARLPLDARLDIVAQIADALALAHSVGALHKDLKPGNVLIEMSTGRPRIKLCDFGCGGVLDPQRLEALGITQLGFTTTAAGGAGTAAYLAPEVVAGQPCTVKADIYALGVLLYQVLIGNLHKPLAPGWEFDLDDELLREDVAAAAAGNPDRRLAEASVLVDRLRTLEKRRQLRAAEVAARERADRMRRQLQALRRARVAVVIFLTLASCALGAGIVAFRERNEALSSAATAKAISAFLTDDVLRVDPAIEHPATTSYGSLLNRASSQVSVRFKDEPDAAASIHWLLGRRYQEIGQIGHAADEYQAAADLFTMLYGAHARPTLLVLDRLVPIYLDKGRLKEALALADDLERNWSPDGRVDLASLMVRVRMSRVRCFAGQYARAQADLRVALQDVHSAEVPTEETRDLLRQWLGISLAADISRLSTNPSLVAAVEAHAEAVLGGCLAEFVDDYQNAEPLLRTAFDTFVRLLGPDSEPAASTGSGLGYVLAMRGNYAEGVRLLSASDQFYESWLPRGHGIRAIPKLLLARIELEQHHLYQAQTLSQDALLLCGDENCPPRVKEEIRFDLANALLELGRLPDATTLLESSLRNYEALRGPDHVGSLRRRIAFAQALLELGKTDEARAWLSPISAAALQSLPPDHTVIVNLKRAWGLLLLNARDSDSAQALLAEAHRLARQRYGESHWRTERAKKELSASRQNLKPST